VAWADSHCHVQYEGVGLSAVDEARAEGVERVITIGTDAEESRKAIDVADRSGCVWATVGVHPHDATEGIEGIIPLLGARKVVAIGECGLDYHYDHSPRDVQQRVFAQQVALALEENLALVIHTREGWDDTFAILDSEGVPPNTVLHCFTGGPDEARRGLDIGAYLSFSGIVTFKGADDVRAAAALCPVDRMLVETDAPFLAPVPHRGQQNRPAWVKVVGEAVAAAAGVAVEDIEGATWENTARVFGLE